LANRYKVGKKEATAFEVLFKGAKALFERKATLEGLTLSLMLFDLSEDELLKSSIKELLSTGPFDQKKIQIINKYLNRFRDEETQEFYNWVV
jgi:hypothetical protein